MSARKRVLLLARSGSARERAEAAVVLAGADVAAVLDPVAATEADVRAVGADAILVILDPAIESALQKFDDLLIDPTVEVMFDDADVAAKREGWEAARWARHMAAKLYGHDNVLPGVKPVLALEDLDAGAVENGRKDGDNQFDEEMVTLQLQVEALPDLPHGNPDAAAAALGAVVILAGIGGPDAVRQVLGGMPAGFPRPILLQQRIEGGHYDKLVRQMKRATVLDVVLAVAGDPVRPGAVHVLPDGFDVLATTTGLVFVADVDAPEFAALNAADSAMLLLSGADAALVDRAMAISYAGGLVLGQSTENCFDPATSNALVARGGQAASIAKLPQLLCERWSA